MKRKERRSYVDDWDIDDDEIEGYREWNLEEKLNSDRYCAQFVRQFQNAEDFDLRYLQARGFNMPILFKNKAGLGIRIPTETFSVDDVKRCVGARRLVDVIDVQTQKALVMNMRDWCKYFNQPERERLLNVISLEFSHTKLDHYVESPTVVRQIDWVDRVWPEYLRELQKDTTNDMTFMKYPKVRKYVLMSVRGCYTDFHVDFGGTSVWYHILRGEKVFWLIPPTEANLQLYEHWCVNGKQGEVFFPDMITACERVSLPQGSTFFLPPGWIHGVYTPVDSLVFGGNYLHTFGTRLQLRVWRLEDAMRVKNRFRYPFYTELHWYVLARYVSCLLGREYVENVKNEVGNEENKQFDFRDMDLTISVEETKKDGSWQHITKFELDNLQGIILWLRDQPPCTQIVPNDIRDPKALLLDAQRMVNLHRRDDFYNKAVTGVPVLKWTKTISRTPSPPLVPAPVVEEKGRRKGEGGRRRIRCMKCEPCLRDNCLDCVFCRDMVKNGGPGVMKKCCIQKGCLAPLLPHNAICEVCGRMDRSSEAEREEESYCPENDLLECGICWRIAHPRCVYAESQARGEEKVEGVIEDDLPNYWQCSICIRAGKKGRMRLLRGLSILRAFENAATEGDTRSVKRKVGRPRKNPPGSPLPADVPPPPEKKRRGRVKKVDAEKMEENGPNKGQTKIDATTRKDGFVNGLVNEKTEDRTEKVIVANRKKRKARVIHKAKSVTGKAKGDSATDLTKGDCVTEVEKRTEELNMKDTNAKILNDGVGDSKGISGPKDKNVNNTDDERGEKTNEDVSLGDKYSKTERKIEEDKGKSLIGERSVKDNVEIRTDKEKMKYRDKDDRTARESVQDNEEGKTEIGQDVENREIESTVEEDKMEWAEEEDRTRGRSAEDMDDNCKNLTGNEDNVKEENVEDDEKYLVEEKTKKVENRVEMAVDEEVGHSNVFENKVEDRTMDEEKAHDSTLDNEKADDSTSDDDEVEDSIMEDEKEVEDGTVIDEEVQNSNVDKKMEDSTVNDKEVEDSNMDDKEVEDSTVNDKEVEDGTVNDEVEDSTVNDEVEDSTVNDKEVEDSTTNDKEVEDSTVNDKEVEDSTVNDKEVEDSNVNDKDVEDRKMDDEKAEDSTVNDKEVEDSNMDDKEVEDSNVDDEGVEDSTVDDERVEDSNVDDERVEDSNVNDKEVADSTVDEEVEGGILNDKEVDNRKIDDEKADDSNMDDEKADDSNMDDEKVEDSNVDDEKVEDSNMDDKVEDSNMDDKVEDSNMDDEKVEDSNMDDEKVEDSNMDDEKVEDSNMDVEVEDSNMDEVEDNTADDEEIENKYVANNEVGEGTVEDREERKIDGRSSKDEDMTQERHRIKGPDGDRRIEEKNAREVEEDSAYDIVVGDVDRIGDRMESGKEDDMADDGCVGDRMEEGSKPEHEIVEGRMEERSSAEDDSVDNKKEDGIIDHGRRADDARLQGSL